MKRMSLLVVLVALIISGGVSAKVYTLEECIQMAKEKDPNLTSFRNAVKTANATVWQQAGAFLPRVGVSYNQTEYNRGPLSPQFRYIEEVGQVVNVADSNSLTNKSYSAGISMQMTLFNGFQNVWNYLGSKASKRQSEYTFSAAVSDVVYLVKAEYYLVLKSKKDLEVARDAVARSEELLKLFQEKFDLGSASLSEVLKQKVQFGNDQLTRVRAEKNLELALDNLALDIGVDPQSDVDIVNIELTQGEIDELSTYIDKALQNHPSLLSAQSRMNAYKYDVRSAWGYYMPSLSLSYSYGWSKEHFSEIVKFGPFDHSSSLNLNLSWTVFDGFTREANLTRAKAGLNNSRASHFYIRNQVVNDVKDAYRGIRESEEILRVTEEIERSASEDMDLVQEKYNLGAAALWELLDAQVSLKEAQFNRVKAEFDYNLSLAQLQNAIGQ